MRNEIEFTGRAIDGMEYVNDFVFFGDVDGDRCRRTTALPQLVPR